MKRKKGKPHEGIFNWQKEFVPEEFPEGAYGAPCQQQSPATSEVRKPLLYLVMRSRN